eukprot:s4804_g5.t1
MFFARTAVAVVARSGMLLEFASARLRADRALIKAAVCQNVFAFQFARLETADLRTFAATEVLKKLGVTGDNVAHDVRQHAAEAYKMCRTCPSLLQALQTLLREADTSDAGWLREFCLEGVKQEPSFYKALSASEQLDMEIATAAVRLDPCLFPHDLPKEIRSCFNIQVAAVAQNVSGADAVLLAWKEDIAILQLLAGEAEPGDEARRVEEKFLMTKCSSELRGRILDPEGRPLDGLPMPEKLESRQIFMTEKPKEAQWPGLCKIMAEQRLGRK